MEHRFFSYFNEVLYDLIQFRKNKSISAHVLKMQILFTGYEALSIVCVLALMLGAIIISSGYDYLGKLGQTEWIYKILISTMVRDVGPMLTAFIILARSGTAISTELGNMVVRKEIDALKSMGISPISYLVTPRVLGMILSMNILIFYFIIIGICGGYVVSYLTNPLPIGEFFNRLVRELSIADLFIMQFKVASCGFLISLICSYQGLSVVSASTEVPQRNIKSVMQSMFMIIVVNLFGSVLYFLVQNL